MLTLITGSALWQIAQSPVFAQATDGISPRAGLTQGSDGYLYGITSSGGANNLGTLYKVDTTGANYSIVHSFAGGASDGANPWSTPFQGADGMFYGVTYAGGSSNVGIIYKIDPATGALTNLYSFTGSLGAHPDSLTGDTANPPNLYVTTWSTTIVKCASNGTVSLLHTLTAAEGQNPNGILLSGGALYATAGNGGANGYGSLIKLNTDGTGFSVIHSFTNTDGSNPLCKLLPISGVLYGTTGYGTQGTDFKINPDGTGFAQLTAYSGTGPNFPTDGLAGTGTFAYGVSTKVSGAGNGSVYSAQLTSPYTIASVHSFIGTDGSAPQGPPLLIGSTLYGATFVGGAYKSGVVYKVGTNGTGYTILHQFHAVAPDVPTGLSTTLGTGKVTLSWVASNVATSYKIYRGTSPGSETLLASPVGTGTSYIDTSVSNGVTYYYKVSAVNAIGESAMSGEAAGVVLFTSANTDVYCVNTPGSAFWTSGPDNLTLLTNLISGPITFPAIQPQPYGGTGVAYSQTKLPTANFNVTFKFTILPAAETPQNPWYNYNYEYGCGFVFCIQSAGNAFAVDSGGLHDISAGGSQFNLGYAGVNQSLAVKFDTHQDQNDNNPPAGQRYSSTGCYVNGAILNGGLVGGPLDQLGYVPADSAQGNGSGGQIVQQNLGTQVGNVLSNLSLLNANVKTVNASYNGATLTVTISDSQGTDTRSYLVNIPSYAGPSAYFGFTVSNGGGVNTSLTNIVQINSWQYSGHS